jgi:hypothetical protein
MVMPILLNLALTGTATASPLFTDSFESGDLSHTENGISWTAGRAVEISSNVASGAGSHSLRYFLSQGFAEQRFHLGSIKPTLTIEFDLYVPNGYSHASTSPNNNKFFRIWDNNDYSKNAAKVGASLYPSSESSTISKVFFEYWHPTKQDGITKNHGNPSYDLIKTVDLGKWMTVRIYCQPESSPDAYDGILRMWKNGEMVLNYTNVKNNYPGYDKGWSNGYLLGHPNAKVGADLYIDNVKFWQGAPSDENVSPPMPPSSLRVDIQ